MTSKSEYTPIKQLVVGQEYDQTFMVGLNPSIITRNGKSFIKLTLKDCSGEINGVIWDCKVKPEVGDFIVLKAKIGTFNQKPSFTAVVYSKYNGKPTNLTDYVPGVPKNGLDAYCQAIYGYLDQVDDPHYRDIAAHIKEMDILHLFREAPYEMSGSLCYRGGLLKYTLDLIRASLALSEGLKGVDVPINRSLIILGALFKESGWCSAGSFNGDIYETNDAYKLLGIDKLSFLMVNHACITTESDKHIELSLPKKLVLENIPLWDMNSRTLEKSIIDMAGETLQVAYKLENQIRSKTADQIHYTKHNGYGQ